MRPRCARSRTCARRAPYEGVEAVIRLRNPRQCRVKRSIFRGCGGLPAGHWPGGRLIQTGAASSAAVAGVALSRALASGGCEGNGEGAALGRWRPSGGADLAHWQPGPVRWAGVWVFGGERGWPPNGRRAGAVGFGRGGWLTIGKLAAPWAVVLPLHCIGSRRVDRARDEAKRRGVGPIVRDGTTNGREGANGGLRSPEAKPRPARAAGIGRDGRHLFGCGLARWRIVSSRAMSNCRNVQGMGRARPTGAVRSTAAKRTPGQPDPRSDQRKRRGMHPK